MSHGPCSLRLVDLASCTDDLPVAPGGSALGVFYPVAQSKVLNLGEYRVHRQYEVAAFKTLRDTSGFGFPVV
ncbi:MAG: hypothetical protein ABJF04_06805 [Reichenbachiella sp.]|uniref:hypothetical protein n=1 Tax=Reichenbachiella sp. TaxID=2184521 RepID=UPI003266DEBA